MEGGVRQGRVVARCLMAYSKASCPIYLTTHPVAVVVAVSLHKSVAQRAIAGARAGGAPAMSCAERRLTHRTDHSVAQAASGHDVHLLMMVPITYPSSQSGPPRPSSPSQPASQSASKAASRSPSTHPSAQPCTHLEQADSPKGRGNTRIIPVAPLVIPNRCHSFIH